MKILIKYTYLLCFLAVLQTTYPMESDFENIELESYELEAVVILSELYKQKNIKNLEESLQNSENIPSLSLQKKRGNWVNFYCYPCILAELHLKQQQTIAKKNLKYIYHSYEERRKHFQICPSLPLEAFHIVNESGLIQCFCPLDFIKFSNEASLEKHLKGQHIAEKEEEEKKISLHCLDCLMKTLCHKGSITQEELQKILFTSNTGLYEHLQDSHNTTSFEPKITCICGKSYHPHLLIEHVKNKHLGCP